MFIIIIDSVKVAIQKTINKDYTVGFNEILQKKEVQIISSDTGRVQYGSRWTAGIHEFVEIKEGLIPEEESSVIGCISHPTYFQNYQTIFGLTGTIGEEIEKKEINEIYDLELYNLPRNFEEKLVINKPEILETKTLKYNRIIEIIKENTVKQLMLILLKSIQESLEFSDLLKKKGLNPLILNDVQKEKEEYILERAGNTGSILVSTIAAGRGTDIILSKEALNVGGLYVILGFFPKNSRIEYQGIGRTGRQGQPGNAKIVFSKDEPFVKRLTLLSFIHLNQSNDITKQYYQIRNIYIEQESQKRIKYTEMEKISFKVLQRFFIFKRFLLDLFKNPKIKNIMKYEMDSYSKFLMKNIDQLWANYYSEKVSERNLSPTDTEYNLFIGFLKYFLKEFQIIQANDPRYKDNKNSIFINIIEKSIE
ncbi:hypothetical protein PIROE2DRAFT_10982 [Piromyces sp. E2]|nr:hypothetical protein PIROE2DRAFT_10982 [Piromyces sp. E2]|eukprot:OUM62667.1 hypothetical protein PIROE2DRAFT_10982 [Piromyces sp. E2]